MKGNVVGEITLEEVAEWSKAADCKSVSYARVGSNPIFLN